MHKAVIAGIKQVNERWLTAVLQKSGVLVAGEVAGFSLNSGGGNWSDNAIISLQYSPDAAGDLPLSLFLKMVDTGASSTTSVDDEHFGDSEVIYYTRDYVDMADAPLLRCYDGAYSAQGGRYHLLLEDLSETHVDARHKKPNLEYGLALADGVAAMHARWWGKKGLEEAGASMHSSDHILRFVSIAEPGAGHIIEHLSGELQSHWPDLIRELYARHPQVIVRRAQDTKGFTLVHGDAGQTNILVPKNGNRPIYIIDRQPFNWSLTIWLGAYDLAYAMVLDWDVTVRRKLEIPVLERYLQGLVSRGMKDYPWQQLYDDYRLCVAMGVYIATEYCRGGINQRQLPIWLPMLQRSLTACEDLDCSELW